MGKDPLPEEEIAAKLAALPGWVREGDTITRTFGIRYHGGVAMIVNIADVQRLIGRGHRPAMGPRTVRHHDARRRTPPHRGRLRPGLADRPDRCGTPGTVPQRLTGSHGYVPAAQ